MDEQFKDKSCKVVVIEASGAARTLLSEVVRSLGFTDVTGVPGIKEAIGLLEVEPVGWLITPILNDPKENGMQLLKLFCNQQSLRKMRVSFLIEEAEMDLLPDAFASGLLSYHFKPFTKDSLSSDLNEFLKKYEEASWSSAVMAANYLREALVELKRHSENLQLERQMIDMFPGNTDLLFHLVPPLVAMEQSDEALITLKQIEMMDEELKPRVEETLAKHLEGRSFDDISNESPNFLKINKILVVEPEESVAKDLEEILSELGIPEIILVKDGEEAIKAIEDNEAIEIIIHEWRLPKLAGPMFLQRAQEKLEQKAIFVVNSSLVEEQDYPFVREMGVAQISSKPVSKGDFKKMLIRTIQQDRRPTDQAAMERKMRQFLSEKKIGEAEEIRERFTSDDQIEPGAKFTIEAEFALQKGEYEKARLFAIEAIKNSGDSIFILNLLGKTMMHLREFEVALKCFEKAKTISPMNIERLCQIAEVQSEMGKNEEAKETMEDATLLDPDSERVKETEAKLAINDGNPEEAKKMMGDLKAIENVVAYMNNQAVAMARCGMIKEGIEEYKKTLAAIPDNRQDIIAIVNYNLALANIRAESLQDAIGPLEVAEKIEATVQERAKNLLAKLKKAIDKGKPLTLKPVKKIDPAEQKKEAENPEIISAAAAEVSAVVAAEAGAMGLHLIFVPKEKSSKAEQLVAETLRFVARTAISREESGGADKMMRGA